MEIFGFSAEIQKKHVEIFGFSAEIQKRHMEIQNFRKIHNFQNY